jgi:hypothetical protein
MLIQTLLIYHPFSTCAESATSLHRQAWALTSEVPDANHQNLVEECLQQYAPLNRWQECALIRLEDLYS